MKNMVIFTFLLILHLSPTLLALKLNGQAAETRLREASHDSHRSSSSAKAAAAWPPAIPMWSFLPEESSMGGGKKTESAESFLRDNPHQHHHFLQHAEDRNGHTNEIPPLHPDEILEEAEDISALLSPRRLNPLKRSSSISYSLADSIRKTDDLKRSRPYDVPQIECPLADDGMERFACPTPDAVGRYRCVDDHVLCDGFIDCPNAEDENRQACMFYKTTKAHLDVLADALLRWARGRR